MHHSPLTPATTPTGGAIRAATTEAAALALKALKPFDFAIEEALDAAYGAGNWFLYWDEDLRGHPIRGTVTLAYGRKTLVVG
ncbi:MAG: hypothetical protein J0I99_20095 [Devosia sp.]|uniref:hypothetical protein n=1 Tax=Devosia sp. TaxID=1871048 RepID=UPI001AC7FF7A|nr:hypothetical protein [Devosia sp.]MBN9311317.1 hypothetical protein [Devosia sp.]MBN9318047.1 hypothetical protein [Devosia sp.]